MLLELASGSTGAATGPESEGAEAAVVSVVSTGDSAGREAAGSASVDASVGFGLWKILFIGH